MICILSNPPAAYAPRYVRKTMSHQKIPQECKNKCDCCGLKQVYPPDTGTLFQDLRILYDKGIINQTFPRKLYDGDGNDRDEFCLVANPSWLDINAPCDNWILFHPDLKKSDYLSLSSSKEAIKSAKATEKMTGKIMTMTKAIYWLTGIMAALAVLSILHIAWRLLLQCTSGSLILP